MKPPFVIFSLPRSRTYWTSRFLSYGDWTCSHEESLHVRGLADVKSWLSQEKVGTVETALSPYWRLMKSIRHDVRVVTIRRPVEEVVESLMATGAVSDREHVTRTMRRFDHKLDQVERRVAGVLSIKFDDLAKEHVCAELFEHCLPYNHDGAWWQSLANANLQINLAAMLRYEAAHEPQLRLAKSIIDQESRTQLWFSHEPPNLDGITFQEEPFWSFWRDGKQLFAQHSVDVGEASDQYMFKNLPLVRKLDELGSLQIMTARCNGRMFGYLVTVVGPCPEQMEFPIGTQTIFYASRDSRGLGRRLQRASINALRARNKRLDIIMRAGIRGSGPKMEALYKRMGAEPYGKLYKLSLGGT